MCFRWNLIARRIMHLPKLGCQDVNNRLYSFEVVGCATCLSIWDRNWGKKKAQYTQAFVLLRKFSFLFIIKQFENNLSFSEKNSKCILPPQLLTPSVCEIIYSQLMSQHWRISIDSCSHFILIILGFPHDLIYPAGCHSRYQSGF